MTDEDLYALRQTLEGLDIRADAWPDARVELWVRTLSELPRYLKFGEYPDLPRGWARVVEGSEVAARAILFWFRIARPVDLPGRFRPDVDAAGEIVLGFDCSTYGTAGEQDYRVEARVRVDQEDVAVRYLIHQELAALRQRQLREAERIWQLQG